MSSTAEKRAARALSEREEIPYTMALRLLREAKGENPEKSWSELASEIQVK